MGHKANMQGFNVPRTVDEKREAILEVVSGINADLDEGIISESFAFDLLCDGISMITGITVEPGQCHSSC